MLRYLSFLTLCDVVFGLFMISWFITRHVLFVLVIISVWRYSDSRTPHIWDPERGYFLSSQVLKMFNGMLICLEVCSIVR